MPHTVEHDLGHRLLPGQRLPPCLVGDGQRQALAIHFAGGRRQQVGRILRSRRRGHGQDRRQEHAQDARARKPDCAIPVHVGRLSVECDSFRTQTTRTRHTIVTQGV